MVQGMDLASFPRGNVGGEHSLRHAVWIAALASLASACVVLPEVEPPVEPERSIVINKAEVKPSLLAPVKVELGEPGFYFEIPSAIQASPSDLATKIYWYYDYDPDLGLPIGNWQTCGGGPRCFLTICNRPDPDAARHHLWVVVADGDHKAGAKKPFDFADGVVFDAVVWEIEPEAGTECAF